jgi:hypothetical protein
MLDPYELLARMCAMVPPPWFNMIRFPFDLGGYGGFGFAEPPIVNWIECKSRVAKRARRMH